MSKEETKDGLPAYKIRDAEVTGISITNDMPVGQFANVDIDINDSPRDIIRKGIQYCVYDGDPIKALCWKQPFSSLMLPPWNKIETRTRPTTYRGLVLIVATANPYKDHELVKLCGGEQALMIELKVAGHDGYMNGCAIGIGLLSDCGEILDGDKTYIHPTNHAGRYAWRFTNVFPIEPIPVKGFQGWRNVSDELRAKIKLV